MFWHFKIYLHDKMHLLVFSTRGQEGRVGGYGRDTTGIRQQKNPYPLELDGACRLSGKIGHLSGNLSNKMDGLSKGLWTPHIFPWVGNKTLEGAK